MPAIHYRKAIRTAPEKVITARNAYHAQAVKNLAEAQISLERYEKRKA